jgi:acetyl/propionyl-CoA carboxylase alpha subunit
MPPRIRRVLVADRGEIAVRIIHACHQLGLEAVALFSEPDARSLHVRLADQAWPLRGRSPAETYLDRSQVLAAASALKCDAVHPGCGFLSENDEFAMLVQNSGLVFVGPRASTIALMADKSAAKDIMEKAGVPVVPGYSGFDQRDERLEHEARRIGTPLLIKAALGGGGGKGMRLVQDPAEFSQALQAARHESRAAFGSERVLLESHLRPVRHVEVQILGDHFGKCLHLLERECSIQRYHQKIIAECPAPAMDEPMRQRICAAALLAAQAVSYTNAGTVEFLLDDAGRFYFLEMNTRLQVEHPVTEWVTGVDLVRQQLHIAAGRPLELRQSEIRPRGHAIEARVHAEDPSAGFTPGSGTVTALQEPAGPFVRIDSCLFPGCEVPADSDPLLAKLSAFGWTRSEAIERLDWALGRLLICGLPTNVSYLRAILAQSAFHAADTCTEFLELHLADWTPEPPPLEAALIAALALSAQGARAERSAPGGQAASPWSRLAGFRAGAAAPAAAKEA